MLDPKWLEQQVAAAREKREGAAPSAPCHKCGYDLRGLGPGRPCPECGVMPLRTGAGPGRLSGLKRILLAPEDQLRALAKAGWLFGIGFTVFAGGMLVAWICGWLRVMSWVAGGRELQTAATVAALLGAIAWAAGMWIMTGMPIAKVSDEPGATDLAFVPRRSKALAWSVRVTQVLLPVGVALVLASTWADFKGYSWADAAVRLATLAILVALIGASAASMVLREAAIDLEDDFPANMMLWGVWAFPVAGIYCGVSGMVGPYFNWGMGLLNISGISYTLIMLPLPFMLVAAIWVLGATCRWATHHAAAAADKDRRFREKAEAAARSGKDAGAGMP